MSLSLVTAPTVDPISIPEAKAQCLIAPAVTTHDGEILRWITSATMRAQRVSRRQCTTATYDLVMDQPPRTDYVEFPKPPLQNDATANPSTAPIVRYYDTAGVLQTWAASNYVVEAPAGDFAAPGRLSLAYGVSWPVCYGQRGAFTIRFVCGYGAAAAVPSLLKEGMLIYVADRHAQRESLALGTTVAKIPGTADDIFKSFRVWPTQTRRAA